MTNFKKQFITAAAAGAMLLNMAVPAFATEIVISGNGAGTDNKVEVNQSSNTTVTQSNTANVTNNVNADANSGGNDAKYNVGGDVTIDTGKASSKVDVSNVLNSNTAKVDCCAAGDTNVKIDGNVAGSDNKVKLGQSNTNVVTQVNEATVTNDVNADASSGHNDANYNGGGDVTVKTGKASTDVSVSTLANVNSAKIGGGHGGSNPSATFIISNNGAGTENEIEADLSSANILTQSNGASVDNNVDADAKSGGNDANFNTGGEVAIMTGNASTDVNVDNSVNFNFADVDCGCTWDVLAKITGNVGGPEDHHHDKRSRHNKDENEIDLTLTSDQIATQINGADLTNDVNGDSKTGGNDAKYNGGVGNDDPSVMTGNAHSSTDVSNSGNVNSVGDSLFDWPDVPQVDFSFNFAALWAFFGMNI